MTTEPENGGTPGGSVLDDVPILGDIVEGARDAAGAVGNAVEFGADPLGFLFDKTKEAAHGLAENVLPQVFEATEPDLSAGWFLDAYAVSFAVAVFLWVAVLLWTVVSAGRGTYSSDDVAEVLTRGALTFFGGAMFGPAAGWVVLQFIGALTDSIAGWAVGGTSAEVVDSLAEMVAGTDISGIIGGVVIALTLMVLMLIGLVLVVIALVVTMVTVYLAGAVMPIALAWYAHPTHKRIALRLLWVIGGVLAAKPLLLFVLGLAYRMAGEQVDWLSSTPDLATLANLVAGGIALCIAGLMPYVLFKFAPVLPTAAGQAGPALHASSGGKSEGEGESQTVRRSRENSERGSGDSDGGSDGESGPTDGDGGGEPSSGGASSSGGQGGKKGPIQNALEQKQASADGSSGGGEASSSGGASSGGGGEGPAPTGSASTSPGSSAGGSAGSSPGGSAGAAGGGSAGAAGGGSTAAAAPASGGAAGGVAGPVGVAAGVAAGAAVVAAQKSAELGQKGGDTAAAEMDDAKGGES